MFNAFPLTDAARTSAVVRAAEPYQGEKNESVGFFSISGLGEIIFTALLGAVSAVNEEGKVIPNPGRDADHG
jgi:hypothetical protein